MTDSSSIVPLTAILGVSALTALILGNRYRLRRRAEKLRRRGYKDYNRDRPKLVVDPIPSRSPLTERRTRP